MRGQVTLWLRTICWWRCAPEVGSVEMAGLSACLDWLNRVR